MLRCCIGCNSLIIGEFILNTYYAPGTELGFKATVMGRNRSIFTVLCVGLVFRLLGESKINLVCEGTITICDWSFEGQVPGE